MKKIEQLNIFGSKRLEFNEQIQLTVYSLNQHGPKHKHWAIAWSWGKDSTTLVTLVVQLILTGQVKTPKSLTVLCADTRMELTPLWLAALGVIEKLKTLGIDVRVVTAPLDDRYFVYILGRGDGSECGQGWYQTGLDSDICSTSAPIIHWRVCSIWDWLKVFAPSKEYGQWPTAILADAYGGDEAEEINARTGCIGCPLASKDKALESVVKMKEWEYLKPLTTD